MSRIELMPGVAMISSVFPTTLLNLTLQRLPCAFMKSFRLEYMIGRHARGYVALYRYIAEIDTVFVLALRGQREAGYTKN